MQLDQVRPNKPSFLLVVLLSAAAILVLFVGAAILVTWRSHQKNKAPYTQHPQSRLLSPVTPSGTLEV